MSTFYTITQGRILRILPRNIVDTSTKYQEKYRTHHHLLFAGFTRGRSRTNVRIVIEDSSNCRTCSSTRGFTQVSSSQYISSRSISILMHLLSVDADVVWIKC